MIHNSIKIIHTADIHLGMENYGKIDPKTGLNSRLGDFLYSLDAVVDYTISNKADIFLFAGDAFKTRDPSPTYQRAFAERIHKLASNSIATVLLVGNHDLPNTTGKANTLDIYDTLKIPNVYVSRKPEILTVPNGKKSVVQIVTLPWITKSQFLTKEEYTSKSQQKTDEIMTSKISETIKYLTAKTDPKYPTIFLGHTTVSGAVFGGERLVMLGNDVIIPLNVITDKKFDYGALGHLHKYQILSKNPPVIYPGSIERIDFGEEKENRGFIAAEIKIDSNNDRETSFQFIKTPARQFLTIKVDIKDDDLEPNKTIAEEIKKHNIQETIVKVVVLSGGEKSPEIREGKIRELLKEAYFIAGINKQVRRGSREQEISGYSDEIYALTPSDMLEKYFKQKNINPDRAKLLKEYTEKLIEELEA